MMDNLRAAANNVVLKIILALIIASFVLTGVGDYLIGGSGDYAAKVNGQEITRAQLEQAVQNERSRQQEALGENFSLLASNDGYMQQLRRQSLAQLIDEALLDQYADKLGLNISDEQVKQAIFAVPAFQTDNRFDNEKYLAQVRRLGLTPDAYAQLLRKQLTSQQLIRGFGNTEFLLPQEIDNLVKLAAQDRVVRLATIDISARAGAQNVSDDEVRSYYEQNQARFLAPEAFKVSYITLDAAAIMDKVTVTDADIDDFYEKNKNDYTQPERKKFSVIQVKTEADAQSVLDALKQGADFAALAQEKSTDVISRRNGGDLGWMDENSTIDELKQAGLTEKGQLSAAIKSSVGYLIVRLDDIQPQQVKPLSEVRDDIAAKVKHEKAQDDYYALQQKVSEAASNDNESLASAEEAAGVKATQTDWFTREQVPAVLNFQPATQAIFDGGLAGENGEPGSNSDVINVDGDRAFVIRITDHKAESTRPLDQVRDQVIETVKRQKAEQQARVEAEKILAALKQGKDEALKAANLSFGEPKTLSSVSQGDAMAESIFALPHPQDKDKPSYGISQDQVGNVVLVALDSVTPHQLTEQQQTQFANQIQQSSVGSLFDALLSSLRSEAKIKMGGAAQEQQ
ncbi:MULTISPECIES: peptidylprolyl isomerase [Brenneria]|uniref:Periplasmic chaperone PpiD n=1 Tax=Brenneria nigrifluens DSM 30175 = ATCC 13028 TaxID=1121120 RepID=A0A2U1UWC7_9GAMM|nr:MULTISPECIES: peptidylprolyl isomerase [Brenneria]EHD22714.1 PpiC-type peptidyl-prolyl cis-trans isomerase [Brenneria sp. EniD312]PWC25922.1 peptidylprolyl isomerase [Brenneria nigrifluens] [Brenneria nigrifluens DSM 30175 = ATCC 13028]QCR05691.1 peptidylprolyl isomerase [Brenneria nigrifluens] [Brenneria nigrifluens DSM 30175 = ATCC 13028]